MIIPNKVKSGDAITAKMFNQLIDYVKSITPQDGGHSAGTRLTRGTNGFTVSSSPVPPGVSATVVIPDLPFQVYIEEIKDSYGNPTGTWRGYVLEGKLKRGVSNKYVDISGLQTHENLSNNVITWRTVLPTDLFYLEIYLTSQTIYDGGMWQGVFSTPNTVGTLNINSVGNIYYTGGSSILSNGNNDSTTMPFDPTLPFSVANSMAPLIVYNYDGNGNPLYNIGMIRIPIAYCKPDPIVSTTPVLTQLIKTDLQLEYRQKGGYQFLYPTTIN